jgi:hypothetical protein
MRGMEGLHQGTANEHLSGYTGRGGKMTYVGYVLWTAQDRSPLSAKGNAVACFLGFFSLEERVELLEAVGPATAMQL